MHHDLRVRTVLTLVVLVLLLGGAQAASPVGPGPTPSTGGEETTVALRAGGPLARVPGPLVVAVGDIACAAGGRVTPRTCRQGATALQARAYRPAAAFVLGDTQYETGALSAYRRSYQRSWGALKPITRPVPGNHEYYTRGASGYYTYFRGQQPGPPGYYAFDVGGWRVYALNTVCRHVDCAAEARWLGRDLRAHPRRCSMLLMHHPLYSSGREHGDSPQGRRFWRVALRHRVELVLAGHDHDYERFRPMDAAGRVTSRGLVSFVVGTGGKSLYGTRGIRRGSVVFAHHRAGVLALRLGGARYAWRFQTIDGRLVDTGLRRCR